VKGSVDICVLEKCIRLLADDIGLLAADIGLLAADNWVSTSVIFFVAVLLFVSSHARLHDEVDVRFEPAGLFDPAAGG